MEASARPCLLWLTVVWSMSLLLGMLAVLFAPGSPSSATCLLGAIDRCRVASILFKDQQSHELSPKLPSMHVSSSHLAPLGRPRHVVSSIRSGVPCSQLLVSLADRSPFIPACVLGCVGVSFRLGVGDDPLMSEPPTDRIPNNNKFTQRS